MPTEEKKDEANIKSEESTKPQFVILDDNPVADDSFGSHQRLADSLAVRIEKDSEGKTVGLEGGWGSGKSSIIKMLEKKWEDNEDIKVFTYDAWTHQGDSLRRAFLEELIRDLQEGSKQWLDSRECLDYELEKCKKCDKSKQKCRPDFIKDELRLRYEHNVIKTEPTISDWGLLFAVATILMPIGVALFSASKTLGDWYFYLGFIAMAISPVTIACLIVYSRFKRRNMLPEVVGKTKEITKHSTQRTPDPTTIEFQEYYHELLNIALDGNKRKLVIVIDNLDRVESDIALSIWATMRSFLDRNSLFKKEIMDRLWVIVPFDPNPIDKLWGKLDASSNLASAFKEKTFQARYKVSEPLTSKWEDYFKKLLQKSIPNIDENILHAIFQIFRINALTAEKIPTPRNMKVFVNRVVALAELCYSENISLKEIALYASYELQDTSALRNIGYHTFKDEFRIKHLVGEEFRQALAAIHYSVPREEANEIIYEPKIRKALMDGDSKSLNEILVHKSARIVCDNLVKDMSHYWDDLNELLTAATAFRLFSKKEYDFYVHNSIMSIAQQLLNISNDQFGIAGKLNSENSEAINHLISVYPKIAPKLILKLSIAISLGQKQELESDKLNTYLTEWVTSVVKILQVIEKEYYDCNLGLSINMPIEQYCKLLDTVSKLNSSYMKYLCIAKQRKEEFIQYYTKNLEAGVLRKEDTCIIDGLLEMPDFNQNDYDKIITSLTKPYHGLQKEKIVFLYEILFKHIDLKISQKELENLSNKGLVFNTLLSIPNGDAMAYSFINLLIAKLKNNYFEDNAGNPNVQKFETMLLNLPEESSKSIANIIKKFDLFSLISQNCDAHIMEAKAFGQILKQIVNDPKTIDCISVDDFHETHDILKLHLIREKIKDEKGYYDRLALYLVDNGLIESLLQKEIDLRYEYLYCILIDNKDVDTETLEKKLAAELNSVVKEEEWFSRLCKKPSHFCVLDVLIELVAAGHGYKVELTNKFVNALVKHVEYLTTSDCEINPLVEEWQHILSALSDIERGRFRERLLRTLIDNNDNLEFVLKFYSEEIEVALKKNNIENDFIRKVCIEISDRKNEKEMSWMLELFANNIDFLKKTKKENKSMLSERLKDILKEKFESLEAGESNETNLKQEDIKKIADALGVDLVDKKDGGDEPDSDVVVAAKDE